LGAFTKEIQTGFSKMKQLALFLGKIFVFTAVPFALAMSACYTIPFFREPLFVPMGWGFLFEGRSSPPHRR